MYYGYYSIELQGISGVHFLNTFEKRVKEGCYAALSYQETKKTIVLQRRKDLRFVHYQAVHATPTITAVYAKTNNKAGKRQVQALDEEEGYQGFISFSGGDD